MVEGIGDFDLADLHLVRRQFPDRLVTLDGDVITVWSPPPPTRWANSPSEQPPPRRTDTGSRAGSRTGGTREYTGRKSTSGSESDRTRPKLYE
ncbi:MULTISPECIES: hypothetical protein [unclassified Streptomyces]|uniref:hypothetical protein n=1 Tax=unclassified Streptomyces TaxID=2593676 RepID=UPI002E7FBD76|nr:hypothetical protein [Streptomyces sp. NBC_00589]WTI42377.1 hypothetical protein OIC96_49555 [Streptomyces sp. NBC_00775]WUB23941.1 hypothetical protein OHA51_00175 [Streptomyces sp. NBC_00589]